MTIEERLEQIEATLAELRDHVAMLVGALAGTADHRTFGPRPELFSRRREEGVDAQAFR